MWIHVYTIYIYQYISCRISMIKNGSYIWSCICHMVQTLDISERYWSPTKWPWKLDTIPMIRLNLWFKRSLPQVKRVRWHDDGWWMMDLDRQTNVDGYCQTNSRIDSWLFFPSLSPFVFLHIVVHAKTKATIWVWRHQISSEPLEAKNTLQWLVRKVDE